MPLTHKLADPKIKPLHLQLSLIDIEAGEDAMEGDFLLDDDAGQAVVELFYLLFLGLGEG